MKKWKWRGFFLVLCMTIVFTGLVAGCDSGEKVLDEVTGNRAVKQYHKSKKRIKGVEQQQADRYKSIPEEDEKKNDDR